VTVCKVVRTGALAFSLLCAAPAWAGVELGIGLGLAQDLPDAGLHVPPTRLSTGPILRLPARWRFNDGFALRLTPGFGMAWGQDRVEWRAYGGTVPVYSDDHGMTLTTASTLVGPELSPWHQESLSPYVGTSAGFLWARHWHRFDGKAQQLLGLGDGGSGTHPYTDQVAPTVEIHGGVRWMGSEALAIEVEAGYNVAFMREARLVQAPAVLDAVRTAYGLNPISIGLHLVYVLGKGSGS